MVGLLKDAHHSSQKGDNKAVASETGRSQEASAQQARRQSITGSSSSAETEKPASEPEPGGCTHCLQLNGSLAQEQRESVMDAYLPECAGRAGKGPGRGPA